LRAARDVFLGVVLLQHLAGDCGLEPVTVVMARFAIGAVLVGLMLGRRVFSIPRSTWKAGAVCGVIIFLGYATNARASSRCQAQR
jgi:drug/metabolite transporter (DMT)-like permease